MGREPETSDCFASDLMYSCSDGGSGGVASSSNGKEGGMYVTSLIADNWVSYEVAERQIKHKLRIIAVFWGELMY